VRGLMLVVVALHFLAPVALTGPPTAPGLEGRAARGVATRVLQGTVRDVNLPRGQFTLQTGGEDHLLYVPPACRVAARAVTDLRALRAGDEVSVTYEDRGGVKVARSVVVHAGAS
jgi:hypothetical protein